MEIPRHWRMREQRLALTGTACTTCGKRFFAPRPVCDVCSIREQEPMFDVSEAQGQRMRRDLHVLAPAQR